MITTSSRVPVAIYDLVEYAGQEWTVVGLSGGLLTLRRRGPHGMVRMTGVPATAVSLTAATSRWPLSQRQTQEVSS